MLTGTQTLDGISLCSSSGSAAIRAALCSCVVPEGGKVKRREDVVIEPGIPEQVKFQRILFLFFKKHNTTQPAASAGEDVPEELQEQDETCVCVSV